MLSGKESRTRYQRTRKQYEHEMITAFPWKRKIASPARAANSRREAVTAEPAARPHSGEQWASQRANVGGA